MSMGTSSDDSFKRPGAVPFKWESQPGIPKHTANPLADAPSSRPKLQPPPSGARRHHHPCSASASPTRSWRPSSLESSTASPSASPSWNRPTAPAVVASHGCFPGAASPLKRRDSRRSNKSKGSRPDQTAADPRSFSAFSAPLGRSSSPAAAEVETRRRRSFAFSGPLGMSPRPAAEEDWARRGSPAAFLSPLGRYHRAAEEDWARRGSPAAFLSPIGRYHRAAEEAVSATRWLF